MKITGILFVALIIGSVSSLAQPANYVIEQKTITVKKIKNIGIVEPFVPRNITAIKNIIISAVKEEFVNNYTYTFIKNDSVLNPATFISPEYFNEFLKQNKNYDAIMVITQGFIEVDYISEFGAVDGRNYESQVGILIYGYDGKPIALSYKNSFNNIANKNAMKKLKKASQKATASIIKQLNEKNSNLR